MYEVAVIGDKNSIIGFSALGLKAYFVNEKEEMREAWNKVKELKYGLVFVTEPVYLKMVDLISQDSITPIVLVIPAASGKIGTGKELLRKMIEKAVGVDILSKDEEN
jgi:V/A-type H+-transporting ATPase subunit F